MKRVSGHLDVLPKTQTINFQGLINLAAGKIVSSRDCACQLSFAWVLFSHGLTAKRSCGKYASLILIVCEFSVGDLLGKSGFGVVPHDHPKRWRPKPDGNAVATLPRTPHHGGGMESGSGDAILHAKPRPYHVGLEG